MSKFSLGAILALLPLVLGGAAHIDRPSATPRAAPPDQQVGDDCRVSVQHCARRDEKPSSLHEAEPSNEAGEESKRAPPRSRPSGKGTERIGAPMFADIAVLSSERSRHG